MKGVKLLDATEEQWPGGPTLVAYEDEVIVTICKRTHKWIGIPQKGEAAEALPKQFLVTQDNETILKMAAREEDAPAIAALIVQREKDRNKRQRDKGRKR